MQCPSCGEKRVSWKKELWGAGEPQFWSKKKEILFLCGGKYVYDEVENIYQEINPCRRKNEKT
jgi:hypothetical protein